MKKTLPLIKACAFLFFLLLGYGFRSFPAPGPPEQTIEFKGETERFLVFISEELQTVKLCGLEKEVEYLLNVVPAYPEDVQVFTTFKNLGDMSYGKIKAAAPCHTLVIETKAKKTLDNLPVYISVARALETGSVKFSGSGRPPAILTSTNLTASQLVTDVLIGGNCFDVANVTSFGNAAQRGTFTNGATSVGINSGVILATGNVANATGPNNVPNRTTVYNSNTSDPDLAQLTNGVIRDVSRIEFDFTPTADTVTFRYVFASEEYCEFVNTAFNDVFGFFISGPGINGPFSNNAINIAVLPSGQYVSINNVNHQTNAAFYVPNIPNPPGGGNCAGHPNAGPPSTLDCQYDGFTVVLTATAVVIPCSTYHIKLAIADVADYQYDSAVFLEENSFLAGTLAGGSAVGTVQGTNIIYEGCTGGFFLFTRDGDLSEPMTITFTITGTATPGADYEPLPTTITIPAGQGQYMLPINVFADGIAEGIETIILNFALPCQCSQKSIEMQIHDPPPININLGDQSLCGAQSVTLSPSVQGGVPGTPSYNWSNGASSSSITVNPPFGTTTYTVTVTDDCGNTATAQSNVTIGEIPTAALSGSGVICTQGNTGPVDLPINFTGTGPWQLVYSINGQQTTVTTSDNPYILSIANPGSVQLVSVSSTTGNCPGTVSGSVTIPQVNVTANAQGLNPGCNGASTGSVNLSVSGGTAPYNYNWSNGNSSQNPTGLGAGTYTVTVTDANGCEQTASVTLTEPPLLSASANSNNPLCNGASNGAINLSVSGGTGPFTYNWSNGSNAQNPTGLGAGTYTVTVTDANGCTQTASATLSAPPQMTASASGTNVLCNNSNTGSVSLTVGGGTTPYAFQWSNGSNSQNPTGLGAGTYTVTVTDANGCTQTASATLSQPPQLTASASGVNPLCNGTNTGSVSLTVGGGTTPYNFQWSNGSNSQNPTGLGAGPYTVTVTDGNGCTQTTSVTLANPPQITVAPQTVNPGCTGASTGSINITVSNGTNPYQFNWSNNSSNQNQTGLPAGTYTVTVTDANGCSQTASAILANPPQLNASVANAQQINCNNTTGSITTSVSGGTPGYTYQWSPSGNGPNPTGLQAGTYTATVTDANGCTATISTTIAADLVPPNAAASVTGIFNCNTTTLSLSGAGSSTGTNFTYQWSGPGIVNGGNSLTPVVNAPGTYVLTVTNTANGCTQTATVSVQQDIAPPLATGSSPPITCNNQIVTINGAGSSTGPNFTYQWTGPNVISGPTTLNPTVGQPGTYTLTVTNTNNGCTSVANVNVADQTQLPIATGTAVPITCSNPAISINGAGSSTGPNFSYQWSGPGIVNGGTTLNPVVNAPGSYMLTVTNTATGCVNTTAVNVTQNTVPPLVEAGPTAQITCANSSVQLNGSGSSAGANFVYFWSGPGVVGGINSLTPTVNQPGSYTLTVTNTSNGCTATDQVVVTQDVVPPMANVLPPPTITCAVTQVQLNGVGSSTGPNFSYNWTTNGGIIINGANTLTPTVGAGGVYTLTVTNTVNSCTAAFTTVVPTNLAPPTVNAGPVQELTCVVNQVQLIGAGSSTGPNFSYQWTTPNGNIVSGATSLFPVVNAPGSYTLAILNSTNGCSASATTSVIVDSNVPIANAGQPQTITCASSVVTLNGTASSSGPNFSFQWTTSNGNILSGANTPTPLVNQPGQYQLTVASLVNGCQSSSFVTVNQNTTLPDVVIQQPGEVNCFSPQVTLDASNSSLGNMSYIWSTSNGNIVSGQGTMTLVVNQGGSYFLTIQNNDNGCMNGAGVTVVQNIVNPALVIAAPDMITCATPEVALNTTGSSSGSNFQYTWTTPDGQFVSGQNGPAPLVSSGGNYLLTIFNQANNCSSSGQTIVPQDTILPTIALGSPQGLNCSVLDVQLSAVIGGGSGLNFTWSTSDGNFAAGQNTLQPTVNAQGVYLLEVVNPLTGCESADAVVVVQDILVPQALAGPDGLLTCAVAALELDGSASDSGPLLTYQWSTASGNIVSGASTPTPEINAPGTYVLQVYNVENTCQSFDTVFIDQDLVFPVASAAEPILMGCLDPVVTLDGSASSAGPDIVYQWTTSGGNIVGGETTLQAQVDAPGVYALEVFNTFNGCASSTQLTVVQDIEIPVVDAGPGGELTCTLINIQLQGTASGQTDRFVYNWTTAGGNIISGAQGLTPVVNEAGLYTLAVVDTVNNCPANATVEITQDANVPQIAVAPSNALNCVFPTVTLDGTGSSQGPSIVFEWTTVNGNFASGTETLTPVVDMPGSYSLVITDTVNFCVTSQTVQILPDTAAPALAIAVPDQLNCYQPVINISASAGGLPNIDLLWSTADGNIIGNAGTLQPAVDQPGTYTLFVLNNENGCSSQTQTLVSSDFAIPAADAGPQGIVNCEDTVLTLSGTGDGGGAPLAYLWSTSNGNILSGADTPSPQIDQGGLYSLTLTNVQNGCVNSASVQIAQDQIYPVADAGPEGLLNCYQPQIQLNGTSSSTGSQYIYEWTTLDGNLLSGANTLAPSVDAPGTYLLTVTNLVNHCVSVQEALVVEDFAAPQTEAGPGAELTCSITAIALSGSGSQGSEFVYTWTTPDGNIISGASTLSPLVDAPGVYQLEIFNQTNGCSSNDEATITTGVLYPVAAALASDTLTCALTSVQLSGTGSDTGPNFAYDWTTPTGNIVSGGNSLAPVVNMPGTYTLAVANLNNDCVTTLDLVVPIDTVAPLAEAGPQGLLTCAVQELALSGAGSSSGPAFTYQWTTQNGSITGGANTLSPTVNQPGNYQILVINQVNGCLSTDMATVNQDITEPLALASTPGILTCEVTSLNLNGAGSSSGGVFVYEWTSADGNIVSGGTTLSAQVDQPGQYTLRVLNQFNGCSSAATVGVQQNIIDPVSDAGASSILTCAVTSLSLSGSASGNSSNLSYLWTTSGGNISSGANTLAPAINQPGTYLLTVTDEENGCTAIDQVVISQDIAPPVLLIATPGVLTCTQTEVAIDAMASDAGAIFTPVWATSNGNIISGVQALNPLVNQPGLYSLTMSNSENGCVATSSVQVTQDIAPPVVDAGPGFTLPCFEDIAYLQGSASASTGNLSLQWTTSNGQLAGGQNTLSPSISSGGTYTLFVVNQFNGCSASDEVLVLENFPANPEYEPAQPLCYDDKGAIQILGVSGGTPPYLYSINGGGTFQSSALFTNLNAGFYSIVVQDALGCETTPETQGIIAPDPITVDIDGIVRLKLGESYQLQVLINFPEDDIQQITWTPAEGLSCSDCLTPSVTPMQSTVYRVEVIDKDGCFGTASVQFVLDKRPAIYVPNVFSPNGDGENDVFFINAKPEGVRQIKSFLIFSRWGESVFEYTNFQPNNPAFGWDGTHRGRPLDPAVFVWFAEIEFIDGRTELFKGDVALIR